MDILKVKGLKKYYNNGAAIVKALDGIDLSIEQGTFTAITGSSGSGKSTLLHILGGLDTPTEGSVILEGKDLSKMDRDRLAILRRRQIGFVFQSYNLVPMLNVYENIILPSELDGNQPDKNFIMEIVQRAGLEKKIKNMPNQLSGGEQQRVAIARALAARPSILLADEPTGNLDSRTSQDILGLLKSMGERFLQTIIMITHNEEIAQLARKIIHLEDGKISESRWL
ncbi:MAG: ABC transporter ATP-binding protein [Lachnospiraceae bacterium]|nr:ABC transporter ATP-binding protein [Lachnospiraceae bacterium]